MQSNIEKCTSQPWFHIINKETKKKSISEIQEIIDKELGITTSIRDQYEEKQPYNNLRDLEIDKQICSIRVSVKLDDALYLDPIETLLIRQSKSRLSYSEKLEIMKKLRSNLYTKVEIWRRWNINMSTVNRISREFWGWQDSILCWNKNIILKACRIKQNSKVN